MLFVADAIKLWCSLRKSNFLLLECILIHLWNFFNPLGVDIWRCMVQDMACYGCTTVSLLLTLARLITQNEFYAFSHIFASCTASILNLCAISLDRYVAVTRPVTYPSIMSTRRAKSLIAGLWVLSFVICFPPLLGWKKEEKVWQWFVVRVCKLTNKWDSQTNPFIMIHISRE